MISSMTTIQEIERAVSHLSADELQAFRRWFEEFDAALWDKQFERDALSGKLDDLANQALADFEAGKCSEL